MAGVFLDLGFDVDVVDWNDASFVPQKPYAIVVDIHNGLERFQPHLRPDCLKLMHITGAHWLFQNHAEYERLLGLFRRRGVSLQPRRIVSPSSGSELCDGATMLGNDFTRSTFGSYQNKITLIPGSSAVVFDRVLTERNVAQARLHCLWLGSSGMVHKGLDLVLEAFAKMPDFELHVCGPVESETDFQRCYQRELYQTRNIHTIGWVDVGSPKFYETLRQCLFLVYPSCSEGQAGSVLTCLHGGLIPIASRACGVDIEAFGYPLEDCSQEGIPAAVKLLAALPAEVLAQRSQRAWEYARQSHTRKRFEICYRDYVNNLLHIRGWT